MNDDDISLTPFEARHVADVLNRAEAAHQAFHDEARRLRRSRIFGYAATLLWTASALAYMLTALAGGTHWWVLVTAGILVLLAGVLGAALHATWPTGHRRTERNNP